MGDERAGCYRMAGLEVSASRLANLVDDVDAVGQGFSASLDRVFGCDGGVCACPVEGNSGQLQNAGFEKQLQSALARFGVKMVMPATTVAVVRRRGSADKARDATQGHGGVPEPRDGRRRGPETMGDTHASRIGVENVQKGRRGVWSAGGVGRLVFHAKLVCCPVVARGSEGQGSLVSTPLPRFPCLFPRMMQAPRAAPLCVLPWTA